jgi:predicted NUDIX family NTP pyrophosphohydrolase
MAAKLISAGLLCYRRGREGVLEVLLAHPGGPYFARKDLGAWGIPKGIVNEGEDLLTAARREFEEELGWPADGEPEADYIALGWIRMKSGKTVHAWGWQSDRPEPPDLSGTSEFSLEWPPKSGRQQTFPEIDRAGFFGLGEAAEKIVAAQRPFLERLQEAFEASGL